MVFTNSEKRIFLVAWLLILLHAGLLLLSSYNHRYLNLDIEAKRFVHTMPVRDLTQDSKVLDYLAKHPVYLSLSTTPQRIKQLDNVLRLIDTQFITTIFVNIPEKFRNIQNYDIPASLIALPKVKIQRIGRDLGPISKSLPTIEYALAVDPKALIITIDDDYLYPRGVVNEHIYALVHNKAVVTGSLFATLGAAATRSPVHYQLMDRLLDNLGYTSKYWLAQGVGSLGFVADSVDLIALNKVLAMNGACVYADDVLISYGLLRKGVKPMLIHNKYLQQATLRPYWVNQTNEAISKMSVNDLSYWMYIILPTWYNNHARIQSCFTQLHRLAK